MTGLKKQNAPKPIDNLVLTTPKEDDGQARVYESLLRQKQLDKAFIGPRLHRPSKVHRSRRFSRDRTEYEKQQIDERVLNIVNSVSYDTLLSIKRAVKVR